MKHSYLKGLNTLRFLAAFFVVISHGQESLFKLGYTKFKDLSVFNKGGDAVEFFYVLSGFLITFLLLREIADTGTVSIKKFYMRRVYRIWPLYFLVVAIGFILLGLVVPRLTGQRFFEFPILKGLVLFLLFLPNLATSLYSTGLLFPLRTIGVEEQYYLFWAPFVKLFRKNFTTLLLVFLVVSYIWYYLIDNGILPLSRTWQAFLGTQKFYAMATGGVFGLILFKYSGQYKASFFAGKLFQWIIFIVIIWFYLVGFPYSWTTGFRFLMCWIYGGLILNCSILEAPVLNLEKRPFVYLGTISYGIYCCHMLVDYFLRFTIMKLGLEKKIGLAVMMPAYHIALIGGAISVAAFSYKYYESYFLRLKDRDEPKTVGLKEKYA